MELRILQVASYPAPAIVPLETLYAAPTPCIQLHLPQGMPLCRQLSLGMGRHKLNLVLLPEQLNHNNKQKSLSQRCNSGATLRGYNEEGLPVSETEKLLEAGTDSVIEEYTEVIPLRRQSALGDVWFPPPSMVTRAKMKNLLKGGYLGDVECFLPTPNLLATSPREGYYAWSGAHTKQGAMLPLLPYFRRIVDHYDLCPSQFIPKGIKYLSALFILYASQGWADFVLKAAKKAESGQVVVPDQEDLSKKKKKAPASEQVPVEHAIKIWEPNRSVWPSAPVEGKGKAVLTEQEQEDSSEDETPSLLVRENAPAHVQVLQALKKRTGDSLGLTPPPKRSRGDEVLSKEKGPIETLIDLSEEMVPAMDPPDQKVSKSKNAKGGSSDGSGPTKSSSTVVVLSSEAKKERTCSNTILIDHFPRMDYAYSRAKSTAAKNLATTNNLQREVDATNKKVVDEKTDLEEDVKARQTREEELSKEVENLETTALKSLGVANSSAPTEQNTETSTPFVQSTVPPAPSDVQSTFQIFTDAAIDLNRKKHSIGVVVLDQFNKVKAGFSKPFVGCVPPAVVEAKAIFQAIQ
uniref:Uncharacterized protein n=1 Tax=Cannabis sativa TaxID=3483 RepID=A0A803P221_CANSA